jgi:mannosyltransferase
VSRERWLDVAVVAAPAALAAILCLYEITTRSLWLDEAATVAIASQHGAAFGSAIAHDGGNMLGYYGLMHVLTGWFGTGALAIRLPSAVAGAAAAGLVSLLALRLFDRRVALISGLLTAVSLPLVFWGQDARGYAAMVALVVGSFLAFVSLVSPAPDSGRSFRGSWAAYVVLTTLSVYMSFVAVLAVPAQLVVLAWRRRAWGRVLSALVVCVVLWIPLAVLATRRGSGQLFWIPKPSLKVEKQVLEALASAGFEPNFHTTSTTVVLLILTFGLLAAVAAGIVARARSSKAPPSGAADHPTHSLGWGPILVLSWLVVPVVLMWLESLVGQSIFTPRNVLVSLPAVALLLGWGVTRSHVPPAVVWLAVAGLIALRALQLGPSYGTSPENWKAATAYVLDRSTTSDCVAFYPLDSRMAFGYYVASDGNAGSSRAPRSVLPVLPWSEVKPYVERYVALSPAAVSRLPSTCPRLWLVSSHEGQASGPATSRANLARFVALRTALGRAYGDRGATTSFGYASPVTVELLTRGG